MSESREFEYKGHTYLIGPIDAITGSRIAMLNLRGLANLSESEFEWVNAKALGAVSRLEEKSGQRLPIPIYVSGRIVQEDLRNDPTAITTLVNRSLNWNVLDDFFEHSDEALELPKSLALLMRERDEAKASR